MSWLIDIEVLHALIVLMDSVFITGDAEPQTSVTVMSLCSSILFILLGIPKLKRRQKQAEAVDRLDKVDLRRLAGT